MLISPQLAKQQEERRHDRDLREHGDRQDGGSHEVPSSESEAARAHSRRRAERDRQQRRGSGDDERVA